MRKIGRIISVLLLCLACPWVHAQQEVEMADNMRSEGKIYVVVAILLVLFTGITFYLFSLDRKASRLEKRIQDHNR
jgi:CcmD family protein